MEKSEIKNGLLQEIIVGRYVSYSRLYAKEGYHFYDKTVEITRVKENGEEYVVPEDEILLNEREFMEFCITPIININELNENYIVVEKDKEEK